jgi:RNA polymerase sigma-70 factor (ECF subfamily)
MRQGDGSAAAETELLSLAQRGDADAFGRLVDPYRRPLHAHCYRMLGSLQDAEDALQETLLAAWRGLAGFEGRSSLQSWLYRIATNAALRLAERRPQRLLTPDRFPPSTDVHELGDPMLDVAWLEPYPDRIAGDETDPEARQLQREDVELAFVAALQHLPANQRAVLLLREVLKFSAAEVAEALDTSVASVNSALQRARKTVDERVTVPNQHDELEALGEDGQRRLVSAFMTAWDRADVAGLLALLAEDVRFSMPPLPAWFQGHDDVGRFLAERASRFSWRMHPIWANGQLAIVHYQSEGDAPYRPGAINILTVRDGRIVAMNAFLDPEVYRWFGLVPDEPDASR